MPKGIVHSHVAKQLVRSATSPAANYAEARASESPRDFVHKMQVCLKELRETDVWLAFVQKLGRVFFGIGTYGGNIIDADLQRTSGPERDNFEEFIPGSGVRKAGRPESTGSR